MRMPSTAKNKGSTSSLSADENLNFPEAWHGSVGVRGVVIEPVPDLAASLLPAVARFKSAGIRVVHAALSEKWDDNSRGILRKFGFQKCSDTVTLWKMKLPSAKFTKLNFDASRSPKETGEAANSFQISRGVTADLSLVKPLLSSKGLNFDAWEINLLARSCEQPVTQTPRRVTSTTLFMVAKHSGRPVACVIGGGHADSATITHIVVDAKSRGLGLGQSLAKVALSELAGRGHTSLHVMTLAKERGAERFWQALGLQRSEKSFFGYGIS